MLSFGLRLRTRFMPLDVPAEPRGVRIIGVTAPSPVLVAVEYD